MITISIDPIIFSIGHFHLRWYSLIVLSAVLVGGWLAAREAKRKGFQVSQFLDALVWIVVIGLLGARLFHVIDHWSDIYAFNPIRALYIWDGGLAIWGGVLGGMAAAAVLARINKWKFTALLDTLVPGAVLGQAIGRVACIITGDAVGKPTTGPLGFAYTSTNAMVPQLGVFYFPTPIFEILMNLGIFTLVWSLRKKNLPNGILSLIYLILYSFGRFFINFASTYRIIGLGLNQAQWVSIFVFTLSTMILTISLFRRKTQKIESGIEEG
jgi:phosphatidylglycerol:prolipoprotein diacylglycerol transferase